MKPQIRSLFALVISFLLLSFTAPRLINRAATNAVIPLHADSELKFPGSDDEFIVYYKPWPTDDDGFYKTLGARYKLIILNTDDLVPPEAIKNIPDKVLDYKKLRIKMLRDLGAMVFGYQSIGSENIEGNKNKPYDGDKLGPCNGPDPAKCAKKGIASYYINNGHNEAVITKGATYVSAPVIPGSELWRNKMKDAAREHMALGCTGIFLDTIDNAIDSGWKRAGAMTLLRDLHDITSNIIVNRGISLLELSEFADDYKQLSWAVMYEDFFTTWKGGKGKALSVKEQTASTDYWAPKLAGKNVLVVDFASCKQLAENAAIVAQQRKAVDKVNTQVTPKWPNYLADLPFKEVRYKFKCAK